MATINELRQYAQDPNVRRFLDVIAQAEGTDKYGYNTAFGGGYIESLSDHPRQLHEFRQTDGKANKTSAAGRYQFLQGTWDDVAGKLGLSDFGPEAQDIAAIELLRRNGALPALLEGDYGTAVKRSGSTWASLPSSPYAQPKRSEGFIANAFDKASDMVFPAAHAGTLDKEWAELESRFRPGGQGAASQAAEGDPWAELERRFAPPTANTQQPTPQLIPPGGSASIGQGNIHAQPQEPAQEQAPGVGDDLVRQLGLTARAGLEGATALPNMLWNGPAGVVNWLAGREVMPRADASATADALGLPTPQTAQERIVGDAAGAMASVSPFGLMSRVADTATGVAGTVARNLSSNIGTQVAAAGGGGASSGIARELGASPAVQLGAGLFGGLAAGSTVSGLANRSARRAAESAVPTVEQLRQQAGSRFEEAHRRGVSAGQAQTQQLANDVRALAQREGLISPTGRVSEAYPKAREALRMLDDYATGSMNVPQMQAVRKVLTDAAKSQDAGERRIAVMMLNQFDDFTAPLAPQLADARSMYSRAMRGDQLETMRELAESRAGQYSVSGMENALRTEYRQLNNRIIKGQERGWSPEQREAIKRVAEGDALTNAARMGGKLAPTGVVSFGLGGGVPYAVGTSIGGPALGAAMGGGAMAGGILSRNLASRLTNKNALLAEMLARGGGAMPEAARAELWPRLLGAALGSQAATDPN